MQYTGGTLNQNVSPTSYSIKMIMPSYSHFSLSHVLFHDSQVMKYLLLVYDYYYVRDRS